MMMAEVEYFEDIVVGATADFGPITVTREEVIAFAGAYDPQPFHLSDEAAAATHFGSLSASGWHTTALFMKMFVEHMQRHGARQQASLGALGVDNLRWLKPVRPGDTLRGTTKVTGKIPSQSRPERGVVRSQVTVYNQHDEPVLTMEPIAMVRTRPA
jgi:acyl dehydratase